MNLIILICDNRIAYFSRKGLAVFFVELGQEVEAGQELGHMQDLFGNIIETYKFPFKGYVRFLRVWYSVNIGEPLVGISAL